MLDGVVVEVTRNLEAALRQLLLRNRKRTLWIDALCINQDSIPERNDQVSKMGAIYQKAEGVAAWLGEARDNSSEAFLLLYKVLDTGIEKCLQDWTAAAKPSDDAVKKVYALLQLYRRDYWMRAWIVQEVAFAQKLVFYCGADHITWDDVQVFHKQIEPRATEIVNAFKKTTIGQLVWMLSTFGPMLMDNRKSPWRWQINMGSRFGTAPILGDETGLMKLLVSNRMKKATDPLDKVYSLRSMLPEGKPNLITVDYSRTSIDLFSHVGTLLITHSQSLMALAENKTSCPMESSLTPHLPSWVPDWGVSNQGDIVRIDAEAQWSRAAGSTISDTVMVADDVLCVKGVKIGTITEVGSLMPDIQDDVSSFQPIFDVLLNWWLMFLSTGKKKMIGKHGFVNILNLGGFYEGSICPPTQRDKTEQEMLRHVRIILSRYRENDDTLSPWVESVDGRVDDNMLYEAETTLQNVAPSLRKRKSIVLDGETFGFGPQCAEVGDHVVTVLGCMVPLVFSELWGKRHSLL